MENNNQNNINSFLDSMDEAPADQFTAAENSFASPVGNPQQTPYTPAAVWPGEQQNEPVPQTAVQPTAPAPQVMPQPQTPPQEQSIPQQAPPMQVITPPVEQSAAPQAVQQPTAPAVNTGAQQSMLDPFEQALNAAQNQQESRMLETLAAKPAFFSYGKVKESIEDRESTFEDLRAKYETDFPELSDGKLISWSVNYGKVTKQINNPASDKVYTVKAEIEKSKAFTDGLKKAKTDAERNPECVVKLLKKAQSKGEAVLPSYKDFCLTTQDAELSEKPIVLLPSKDGRIFELRRTEIGEFSAPVNKVKEFAELTPYFKLSLPKIPAEILRQTLSFFKRLSDLYSFEALVHILYDTERREYTVKVPKQKIGHSYLESITESEYPEHLIHVMDIHSHNIMSAVFSETDDKDETATRLYAVAGRFDRVFPELTVRASCGGKFISIDPSDIFDAQISGEFPNGWNDSIELTDGETRKSNRRFHRIPSERKHFFAGKYISEAGI